MDKQRQPFIIVTMWIVTAYNNFKDVCFKFQAIPLIVANTIDPLKDRDRHIVSLQIFIFLLDRKND